MFRVNQGIKRWQSCNFLIISAICMVLIKFVASWFGYGNIPILNKLVTIILSVFVTFEIVQLVQAIIVKFG